MLFYLTLMDREKYAESSSETTDAAPDEATKPGQALEGAKKKAPVRELFEPFLFIDANELIFPGGQANRLAMLQNMHCIASFHALDHMRLAGIL